MNDVEAEIEAEVSALMLDLKKQAEPYLPPNSIGPDASEQVEGHEFWFASEFRVHTVGWEQHEHGGSTPIIEDLPVPYWRWYCRCGAIGGKFPTGSRAQHDHARHARERAA